MNEQEKDIIRPLYNKVMAIRREHGQYFAGRSFADAVEIMLTLKERVEKYGFEKAFPLSEKQIAYVEAGIKTAELQIEADRLAAEKDAQEQAELRAKIEENNRKAAERTPEQVQRDIQANAQRAWAGMSNEQREQEIAIVRTASTGRTHIIEFPFSVVMPDGAQPMDEQRVRAIIADYRAVKISHFEACEKIENLLQTITAQLAKEEIVESLNWDVEIETVNDLLDRREALNS